MKDKSGKRKVSTSKKTNSETKKISTVSDETKRYKVSEEDLMNMKRKKKKSKKKNKILGIIKKIFIVLFILGILAGLILAGIIAGIFFGFFGDDFKMTKDDLIIQFSNSEVYDSAGNLICTLNGTEQRKIIGLDQMPAYLPKAYVAIEDERFYEHTGVDIKRTGAATVTYLLNRGNSSFGGSTITQQLIKNITKDDEDSALRKVKEMARAIQVEKEISKDNILELYLNVIFVGGHNINGVALGAQYYFNKDVSTLDIAESAFLAGINHTPNSYNPFVTLEEQKAKNISNGQKRTKTVLSKMLELGYINKEEHDVAVAKVDAGLPFQQGILTSGIVYSDHTELAIQQIVDQLMEEKGMTREMAETVVYGGGYKIYTTQVASVQSAVETELANENYRIKGNKTYKDNEGNNVLLNPEGSQAAMVVIDHTTGNVTGCVGRLGAKTKNGDLIRAIRRKQVGSAMKPIAVIAPAVEEGVINGSSVYVDEPINWYGAPVKNQSGRFYGPQTVRDAIKISTNIVPIKILKDTGVLKAVEYLKKMGLDNLDDLGEKSYSLALGAKDYSPLQIAAAYATIANDGVYIEPTFYTKVVDSNGNTIIEPHQEKHEVISKESAFIVKSITTEPVKPGGTAGSYIGLSGFDVAAKTGTTDDSFDRWFCEFTTYYTAACWYGYDYNEEVKYYKSPNPAGSICGTAMKNIHSGLTPTKFVKPDTVVSVQVCGDSGLLPSEQCTRIYTDYFAKSKAPTKHCTTRNLTQVYKICEDTGLLALEGVCPNIIEKTFKYNEEPPTEFCELHQVPEEPPAPSPTPSVSPSPSISPKPSTSPKPSASPNPSGSPNPSTSPKPSASPNVPTTPVPSSNPTVVPTQPPVPVE